jgi:hypothetical protein
MTLARTLTTTAATVSNLDDDDDESSPLMRKQTTNDALIRRGTEESIGSIGSVDEESPTPPEKKFNLLIVFIPAGLAAVLLIAGVFRSNFLPK